MKNGLLGSIAALIVFSSCVPALADSATDAILLRLEAKIDALAKENATLQAKLNRIEGKSVAAIAPATRTAAGLSPSRQLPENVYAASYPVKATDMRAAPAHNWTGFYAGLNAGYATGRASPTQSINGLNPATTVTPFLITDVAGMAQSSSPTTVTGGFQAGYNLQFGRNLVAGFEGDINSFRLSSSASTPSHNVFGFGKITAQTGNATSDWLATVRGRLGYADDRILAYVTGGAAFTNYKDTRVLTVLSTGNGQVDTFTTSPNNWWGWAAGAGLEYAWTNRWSVKAEYLHVDFGSQTNVANRGTTGGPDGGMTNASVSVTEKLTADFLRLGVNYKFGAP